MKRKEKNKVFFVAIIAIVLFVGLVSYHNFNQNIKQTSPKNRFVYPPTNLTGFTLLYQMVGVTGSGTSYFNVPDPSVELIFLLFYNSTLGAITTYNSTGAFKGTLNLQNNGFFSESILPITMPMNAGKWAISYHLNVAQNGNVHFEVYYE
ncbi:MAG: hypothetical protein ACYDAO_06205 [Thermoplasmataceae archaeon]